MQHPKGLLVVQQTVLFLCPLHCVNECYVAKTMLETWIANLCCQNTTFLVENPTVDNIKGIVGVGVTVGGDEKLFFVFTCFI